LARYIRWQALLALLGIALVGALLIYLTLNLSTTVVPEKGGTYVEGVVGLPQWVNPILAQYNPVDRDLCALIFEGLTRVNEQGELEPYLAAAWEVSEDGKVYTFQLRQDVRWHDGVPFTTDDVVFTIQAIQDPDYQGVPYLAELWRSVQVEKIDDYTVRFTLEEPFIPFLDYTTIGLLPAHLLADVPARQLPKHPFSTRPVGTGPFMLEELTTEHALLRVNPRHWGPRPYLEKIEFRFYPSEEALFAAYERGEVKGISYVRPQDIPRLRGYPDLRLYSARISGYTLIYLNLDNPEVPFFQDKRVRQALLYALDRQRLIDRVLNGQGLIAHSPIMPDSWAYDPEIPIYPYDPQQAQKLLDEAGWRDLQRLWAMTGEGQAEATGVREKEDVKLSFTLLTRNDPLDIALAQEIARQWARVGVQATPQAVTFSTLTSEYLRPRRFQAVLSRWQELPPDPDPYPRWHSTQIGGEGQNFAGFVNRDADEAIEQARSITDRARRAALYRQFQRVFAEEVPSLLLYYPVYTYAVDKEVKEVQIAPLMSPGDRFRNVASWYMVTQRVLARPGLAPAGENQ